MSIGSGKCIRPVGVLSILICLQTELHRYTILFVPFFSLLFVKIVFIYLLNFLLLLLLYKPLICKCIIAGFTVELRHSRKMHLALIQRATSPLCVISGHSGVQIKSSVVRLQTHSFLGQQSIVFSCTFITTFCLLSPQITSDKRCSHWTWKWSTVVGVTQPSVTLQLCVCV